MKKGFIFFCCLLLLPFSAFSAEKTTAYPPTCTEAGYILHEENGVIQIEEGEAPLGHDYIDQICSRCGEKEKDPLSDSLPRVELTGDISGISRERRVTLKCTLHFPEGEISCYAFTTYQGHSTMEFDKKNFTIRLFQDERITEKQRISLRGWQAEHKYILKAHYQDASLSRNLIAAGIWADMAKSRENLPPQLQASSSFGAVSGFPVILFLNGEFLGLYTWNLHKDEDLFAMGGVRREAIVIANGQSAPESLFRAPASFLPEGDWELEYCGTGNQGAWAEESFNSLIRFIMESDDEAFRSRLFEYLDTKAAIDYLIFLYALGLSHSGAKDLVMLQYEDTPWIPSAYDMEEAFGLDLERGAFLPPDQFLPVKTEAGWDSKTGSLLWDRLLSLFEKEIRERYRDLRAHALSEESLMARAEYYLNALPDALIEKDLSLYPGRPYPTENCAGQILQYIQNRLPLLDEIFMEE